MPRPPSAAPTRPREGRPRRRPGAGRVRGNGHGGARDRSRAIRRRSHSRDCGATRGRWRAGCCCSSSSASWCPTSPRTPTQPPAVELLRGRIVAFLPAGDGVTAPDVQILILSGPQRGETIDGYLQGPSGQVDLPRYDIGDEVIVNASLEPDSVVHLGRGSLSHSRAGHAAGGLRRRGHRDRRMARGSLPDRAGADAGRGGEDRRALDPGWLGSGLDRDPRRDRRDARDVPPDRRRETPDRSRPPSGRSARSPSRRSSPSASMPWRGSPPCAGPRMRAICRRSASSTSTSAASSWRRSSSEPWASSTT